MVVSAVLQAASLSDDLSNPDGAVTVLAPTDAAFQKIPPADLEALAADPAALAEV